MVTNFFSDREPMKWKLRDAGLLLLSDAASLRDKNISGKSETLVKLIYTFESIIALLEIARLADFISDMNYTVLNREFLALKKDVERRAEVRGSVAAFGIPEKFFAQSNAASDTIGLSPQTGADIALNTQARFAGAAQSPKQAMSEAALHRSKQPNLKDVFTNPDKPDEFRRPAPGTRVEVKRNKRRDSIMNLLQDKPELSIKDITTVITDCSEKTIQRELVAMVNEGILKKEGERRWSKYSLNI
jgi:hypothetical protein